MDSDPALLSQFRQTYGITDAEVHVNRSAVSSLAAEALEDVSPDSASPPHTPSDQFPSTFVGDRLHERSTLEVSTGTTKPNHQQHTQKKSSSKVKKIKLFGRKSATSTGNISLADLASSVPAAAGKELRDTMKDSSTVLRGSVVDSCESSLSSCELPYSGSIHTMYLK